MAERKAPRRPAARPREASRRKKGSAIERTLAILEAMAVASRPRAASDVAAALGVPKPTVHRICLMLEREGFLRREPDAKRFTVGPRLTHLAQLTDGSFDDHRAMARLIEAGRVDEVKAMLRNHIENTKRGYLTVLREHGAAIR